MNSEMSGNTWCTLQSCIIVILYLSFAHGDGDCGMLLYLLPHLYYVLGCSKTVETFELFFALQIINEFIL